MTNEEDDLFTIMAKICHTKERIAPVEPKFNRTGNGDQERNSQWEILKAFRSPLALRNGISK
jgi:hypothetical protein